MKLFKTQFNEIYAYEEDGSQDDLIGDKTPITQEEADLIIASKVPEIIIEKQDKLDFDSYIAKRQTEYPSIPDQLDTLFHGGYDAWKAEIQAIKDKYPKGE